MKLNQLPRLLLLMALVCGVQLSVRAQSKIYGYVRSETEPLYAAKVTLWYQGKLVDAKLTDADGKYEFRNLQPGIYLIKAEQDLLKVERDVTLTPNEYQPLDLVIGTGEDGPQPCLCPERRPQIDPLSAIDRSLLPQIDPFPYRRYNYLWQQQLTRKIDDLAARTPGMVQLDHGDPLHYRGSRSESNLTLIDGRKVRGSDELPFAAMKEVQVLTGGLPAEYGDATGAVIVVTTESPQYHRKPHVDRYWDSMPRILPVW